MDKFYIIPALTDLNVVKFELKVYDFQMINMKAISYRKIVIGWVFINFKVEYLTMQNKHTRLVINKYVFKYCHFYMKL